MSNEDGTNTLTQDIGQQLPSHITPQSRRMETSAALLQEHVMLDILSSLSSICSTVTHICVWFQLKMTKLEIASLSAKSERYIGTEGGGMDQAIAFLGTKGL